MFIYLTKTLHIAWGEEEEKKIPMGNPKEILFSLLKDMTDSYLEDFDKKKLRNGKIFKCKNKNFFILFRPKHCFVHTSLGFKFVKLRGTYEYDI